MFEAVLLSGSSPTRMTGTDADVLVPDASTGSVPDDEADPDLSVMAGSRWSLGTYEVNEEGCGTSWPTHVGVAGSAASDARWGAASQGAHWAKEARKSKTKLHSRTAGSLSVAASWQAGRPCRTCHLVAPMRVGRWARAALRTIYGASRPRSCVPEGDK